MTIVYDHGKVHEDTFLTVILYSLHNDAHAFFHLSRVVLLGKEATVQALEMFDLTKVSQLIPHALYTHL